jgi:hypothetical protein
MRRVRFTIGGDEYEAEMPVPIYNIVLSVGLSGWDVDTLSPGTRNDLVEWAQRNAVPSNRVDRVAPPPQRLELLSRSEAQSWRGYMVRGDVEWVQLPDGSATNRNPITWTPGGGDTFPEYDFYEYHGATGDDMLMRAPRAMELTAELTPEAAEQVFGMVSGGGPAPDPNARVDLADLAGPYPSPDVMVAAYREYDRRRAIQDGTGVSWDPETAESTGLAPVIAARWDDLVAPGPFEYNTGPAAAHLSSDASRSAYAAAGDLAARGDTRDDDLEWPFDWGRPAQTLGNTHEPVYAAGTMPEDSDEEFPETSSAALPDEIDGIPVARPPACDCIACSMREVITGRMEQTGEALSDLRVPAMGLNDSLRDVRRVWAEMVAYATTRVVEGSNSGHPLGILGFLDGARIPTRPPGFLGARATDAIVDEAYTWAPSVPPGWAFEPAGTEPVWAPARFGQLPFAGDWSERLRTSPAPLTVTVDVRDCAPRFVDTPDGIAVGVLAADALEGDAAIRERIRNGDVIELGPDYTRVIRETLTAPRTIRPQRVIR